MVKPSLWAAVAAVTDATAVRMIFGRPPLKIAGNWKWWPAELWRSQATAQAEVSR